MQTYVFVPKHETNRDEDGKRDRKRYRERMGAAGHRDCRSIVERALLHRLFENSGHPNWLRCESKAGYILRGRVARGLRAKKSKHQAEVELPCSVGRRAPPPALNQCTPSP